MNPRHTTHRRAFEGTLVVRVSLLVMGLAAAVGLQLLDSEPQAPASWTASNPSALCTLEAAGSVGFQPSLQ
jgi:hypothetical protein